MLTFVYNKSTIKTMKLPRITIELTKGMIGVQIMYLYNEEIMTTEDTIDIFNGLVLGFFGIQILIGNYKTI